MDAALKEEFAAVRRELAQIRSSQEATYLALSKVFATEPYVPPAAPANPTGQFVEIGLVDESSIQEHAWSNELQEKLGEGPALLQGYTRQPETSEAKPPAENYPRGGASPQVEEHPSESKLRAREENLKRASTQVEEQEKARREKRLYHLLEVNGNYLARQDMEESEKVRTCLGDRKNVELELDAAMFFVIFANAIVIGLSIDLDKGERSWFIVNLTFGIIFWLELIAKCHLYGLRSYFCGNGWKTNVFDAALVLLDTIQLAAGELGANASDKVGVDASLFRLLKIFRLTRMLRVLRWEGFKDLLAMVQGILAGMSTLVWAMVLFFLMVYVTALLCRTMLSKHEKVAIYFDSLPRSLFTVFRCSFGDCSTDSGTPIIEQLSPHNASVVQCGYIVFLFFMVVGLFNIISAIFVDSTMNYASNLAAKKLNERLDNEELFASNVSTLIRCCLEHTDAGSQPCLPMTVESFEELRNMEFKSHDVNDVILYPQVEEALEHLDIDRNDIKKVNDILDPDRDGVIPILDLVTGLMRLRGVPRRGDIICIDLMIRSLQKSIARIEKAIKGA